MTTPSYCRKGLRIFWDSNLPCMPRAQQAQTEHKLVHAPGLLWGASLLDPRAPQKRQEWPRWDPTFCKGISGWIRLSLSYPTRCDSCAVRCYAPATDCLWRRLSWPERNLVLPVPSQSISSLWPCVVFKRIGGDMTNIKNHKVWQFVSGWIRWIIGARIVQKRTCHFIWKQRRKLILSTWPSWHIYANSHLAFVKASSRSI